MLLIMERQRCTLWTSETAASFAHVTCTNAFLKHAAQNSQSSFRPACFLFGVFGLGVSLWMAAMGALMWKRAGKLPRADT